MAMSLFQDIVYTLIAPPLYNGVHSKGRVSYVVPTATQPLFACASCARRKNILELSIPVSCLLIYSYYFNKSFYG